MNLAEVPNLPRVALTHSTWYRTLLPQYWRYPPHGRGRAYEYTRKRASRYSPGNDAFEMLYLAENERVARFEGQEWLGDPWAPGGPIINPNKQPLLIPAELALSSVVDLTDVNNLQVLATSAQEVTGDWEGYRRRTPASSVPAPIGIAPTQDVGKALFDEGDVEGFLYISAKISDCRNLVIFPERLEQSGLGSWVRMTNPDTGQVHELP